MNLNYINKKIIELENTGLFKNRLAKLIKDKEALLKKTGKFVYLSVFPDRENKRWINYGPAIRVENETGEVSYTPLWPKPVIRTDYSL